MGKIWNFQSTNLAKIALAIYKSCYDKGRWERRKLGHLVVEEWRSSPQAFSYRPDVGTSLKEKYNVISIYNMI